MAISRIAVLWQDKALLGRQIGGYKVFWQGSVINVTEEVTPVTSLATYPAFARRPVVVTAYLCVRCGYFPAGQPPQKSFTGEPRRERKTCPLVPPQRGQAGDNLAYRLRITWPLRESLTTDVDFERHRLSSYRHAADAQTAGGLAAGAFSLRLPGILSLPCPNQVGGWPAKRVDATPLQAPPHALLTRD